MTDRTPPPLPGPAEPAAVDPADQSAPILVPKSIKRWLPIIKLVGPALVALAVAITDARTGKHEVTERTDTAYETLAPSTNANSKRIKKLEESLSKVANTLELQGRLILAMQPGFTTAGTPAPAPAAPLTPAARRKKHVTPPADPALIKKVQAEAVSTLQAIKQRAADPAPVAAPVPPTIPAQPPALQAVPTSAPEPPK